MLLISKELVSLWITSVFHCWMPGLQTIASLKKQNKKKKTTQSSNLKGVQVWRFDFYILQLSGRQKCTSALCQTILILLLPCSEVEALQRWGVSIHSLRFCASSGWTEVWRGHVSPELKRLVNEPNARAVGLWCEWTFRPTGGPTKSCCMF